MFLWEKKSRQKNSVWYKMKTIKLIVVIFYFILIILQTNIKVIPV